MEDEPIYKVTVTKVGDSCIFRNLDQNISAKYILGNVLAFRYINGKTNKDKQYSLDYAPVCHKTNLRGIEVLASWYSMDTNGKVNSHAICSFINIDQYVANLIEIAIEKNVDELINLPERFMTDILKVLN